MAIPLRILVIEDDPSDFLSLKRHLRQHGLAAECRQVASDADVEAALEEPWDVVLTGYHLPDMDVTVTLARIERRRPRLPVILVSGAVGEEAAVELLHQGLSDFVLKGDLGRLVPAIQRAVDNARERAARLRAELALQESEARLAAFAKATQEGICFSEAGRIEDCNEQFARMLKSSVKELVGRPVESLVAPEDRERVLENIRLRRESHIEYDVLRSDGTRISVEAHGRPSREPGSRRRYTVLRDVTEQRRRERELYQLNRTLLAVGDNRLAMVKAASEAEYLEQACRIVVQDCGHAMVWIGYAEQDAEKRVRPVAHAGFEAGYLETLRVTWADTERGRGPTGTAIRTGQPSGCRNMQADPTFGPWRAEAFKRGYASSIALPLIEDGRAFGAITIYSHGVDAFSQEEGRLLGELSQDIAFGIRTLRLQEARNRAERDVQRTTRELEAVIDMIPAVVYVKDADLRHVMVNRAFCEAVGITPEAARGKRNADILPAALARLSDESDQNVMESGKPAQAVEQAWVDDTGRERWSSTSKTPVLDADGRPAGLVGVTMDITGPKQADIARLESLERQRNALVREIHHRIKNHLHSLMALLRNRAADRPEITAPLEETIDQIRSIAQVYGMQSLHNEGRIRIGELVLAVADGVRGPVPVDCRVPDGGLGEVLAHREVLPMTLIVNELVANAIKHLQSPDPRRPVQVSLELGPQSARAEVRSGPARLPPGFDFPAGKGAGAGLELVTSMLPPEEAALEFRQEGDEVVAALSLGGAVFTNEPADDALEE